MTPTRALIQHAQSNGGIFTVHEAIALGLPYTTLHRWTENGIFVKVARGIFALPGTATRPDLTLRVAQKALGAVVSHQSAARIHEFHPVPDGPPTVTVSHRGTHRLPGVVVHQSTDLLDAHVEIVGLDRVTTRPRTVIDLAQVLGFHRLERMLDAALASGKVDIDELTSLFTALARKGKKGTKNLRAILGERLDTGLTESELEALLLEALIGSGLPVPVRQFRAPWLQHINGRVDLAYPEKRIVVEADSRRWHALFDAFETDRRRDNAAQLHGWIVLRFTWRMVRDEPWVVVSTVREALATR